MFIHAVRTVFVFVMPVEGPQEVALLKPAGMNQISGLNECNRSLLYIIVICHCASFHLVVLPSILSKYMFCTAVNMLHYFNPHEKCITDNHRFVFGSHFIVIRVALIVLTALLS